MYWLNAHRKALLLALRRLAATPLNTLLAVLGIGIALALPVGGWLLVEHVAALGRGAAATPQLTIFLAVEADRQAAKAIESRLKERGDVARTELVTREETLSRMKAEQGLADVIAALPQNPFPDAVIVTPADDSPAAMEKLANEARQWPKVEHVQLDADWAQRLAAVVRLARAGMLLLAALLGLGLVIITYSVIRMQVLMRQTEVEVSRLLGATDAFIRRPFLWFGGLLGLLGGAVAWLIVTGAVLWLHAPVAELARLYGLDLRLVTPSAADILLILMISTLLGWLGAALSMRRLLR